MESRIFIFSIKFWRICALLLLLSDFLKMTAEGGFFDNVVSAANAAQTEVNNIKDKVENVVNDAKDQLENLLKNLSEIPVDETEVVFNYYNTENVTPDPFDIRQFDVSKLKGWRQGNPLKIMTHGWKSSDLTESVLLIKEAYLQNSNLNIITVDWSGPANDDVYVKAASKTTAVGKIVARLLNDLVSKSLVTWGNVQAIGHGLGGHVMGVAGVNTDGKIWRISGVDPSALVFEEIPRPDDRALDYTDALFVDIMHTAGGELGGSDASLGNVDFYPNGGRHPQPGCSAVEIKCSNDRAPAFFAESIMNPNAFVGKQCDNWADFKDGECDNNKSALMGDPTPDTTTGRFFLETNDAPPYGRG